MDAPRFDTFLRALATKSSRRVALRRAASAALGLPPTQFLAIAHAKTRKKKLKFNQFGCVNAGGTCHGKDSACCSGICQGKKPKKGEKDKRRCAGHDATTCRAGQDTCAAEFIACESSSSPFARCVITTGNASYCAGDVFCRACARDADCPREEFERGAACIVCSSCLENTACATLRTFA